MSNALMPSGKLVLALLKAANDRKRAAVEAAEKARRDAIAAEEKADAEFWRDQKLMGEICRRLEKLTRPKGCNAYDET